MYQFLHYNLINIQVHHLIPDYFLFQFWQLGTIQAKWSCVI